MDVQQNTTLYSRSNTLADKTNRRILSESELYEIATLECYCKFWRSYVIEVDGFDQREWGYRKIKYELTQSPN